MVRYAILGCGMMGREHIRNIALLDHSSVVGIYEPDAEMRQLAERLVPNAQFPDSLPKLLQTIEFDCLVVATPNFRHIKDFTEISRFVTKPLLIEKPIVTSFEDTLNLIELSKKYEAPIWVAMEYRYMPALQGFIEEEKFVTGGVQMLSIREHRFPFLEKVNNWNRFNTFTGGTFVEKCCHFFDLMRLIIGCNPLQIMASGGQACNHLTETYDGNQPDIWDSGYVIVDFENGARCMLELCMFADGSVYQEEICAVGAKGKIECKIPGPKRFWNTNNSPQPEAVIITTDRKSRSSRRRLIPVESRLLDAGDHNGSTFYQHKKFYDVVCSNAPVEVDVDDGIWAVRMGLAAQLSSIENRSVKMSEFC